jgi:cell division protein YceG involved in septum cleavage
MLREVEAMKKKVEKIESVYLEQLHYEKMIAQKWRILAIVFMIVALVTNIIWVVVWNQYEYVEEVISEDVITTTIEQGDGTNTISEVDMNGTTYNNY